ncbi:hypothetical protein K1T71_013413 [Dendrolimus kikuchii]|uniref:Uncharacterized protein n=1 Tax=Dendrolimus kikuchii TaxID=765133 RepID=A0ACC1CI19_9NEOP|nr:hypothetical protein K1T71_013413 [Dendrolimus kikuchii]
MHKTELVRALETAIEDAEKCASVIQQLDLNKMRTRTRHHDPKYRLTIHELTLFAAEIDGLACVLPEGSAVKEVLRQTAEFETRAAELLNTDLEKTEANYVRELEEVVEVGSRLCIVLPQLAPLQARLQQAKFIEEVQNYRDDCSTLTPDVIERLLQDADKVVPHHRVEVERAALYKLKAQVEEWEQRARAVLIDTSRPRADDELEPQYTTLAELEALLSEGDEIEAALPSQHALQAAVTHAKDWLVKVEEMQSKDLYPYMHSVEALVKRAQQIPLALFEKDQLTLALQSAKKWKQGAAEMFLKQNWPYSLLEALSPRTAGCEGGWGARRRGRPPSGAEPPPSSLEAGLFLRNFSEDSTPTEIVAAFKQAEHRELVAIKELRARNMRKEVRGAPTANVTFCVCQKRQYGVMTQCELCKDWFHASCITAAKEEREESPDRVDMPFPNAEPKFLCPDCMRTKRPRLDRILALLVWLQNLQVRLAEGEALQCVTERAMAWQDSARAMLASPLLATLPAHEYLDRAQANREKADKLNAELKKATGRAHDAHMSQNPRSSASVEHAYSATPVSPGTRVAPGLLQKLEDLMLEGDLLEVRLEEQASMWGAVLAARGAEGRRGARVLDAGRRKRQRQPRHHHQIKRTRTRPHHGPPPAKPTIKRGSATTTNYLNRKQGMSSGSGLMMRKHYMARQERRKRGLTAPTRGKHPRQTRLAGQTRAAARSSQSAASSSSSASSADDEEDCAAANCLRPTGKVDWVQCDGGCDQWFHMHCVGLSRGALRDDDDYVCGNCAHRRGDRH